MTLQDQQHADHLRAALLKLNPSGQNGFEGLLAVVLAQLTGQPFRLASSGTQRGRDGDSAFDHGATYFEGKRYDGQLKNSDIATKIFDLSRDDAGQIDLWVLGVTSEVSTQVRQAAEEGCRRIGIGVYVLDWSDTDIGALIIALAAAKHAAKDFITTQLPTALHGSLVADALSAIDYFAMHADFAARLQKLKEGLDVEAIGLGHAKAENERWLRQVFSNKALARQTFGQPLAPLDPAGVKTRPRAVRNTLRNAFIGRPTCDLYAIIGDEGTGKTWLVACTWLDCAPHSLLIICTADELLKATTGNSFEELLIQKLIFQTRGHETEATKARWRRRLAMWKQNPHPDNVRLTLVVDGLNQTINTRWASCIDGIALQLKELGACLVCTTRSGHWSQIQSSLILKVNCVRVTNWEHDEILALLRTHGITPESLSAKALEALRNPRIAGIAVELWETKDIEQFEELSVERLMFEHMRRANCSGAAQLTGAQFAKVLRTLAQGILGRNEAHQTDDLCVFDTDQITRLSEVASSQFFSPVADDPDRYEIKPIGLDLGLALWLIDALERELRNGRQPRVRMEAILEPVRALDGTARMVLHATQVACLNNTNTVSLEVQASLVEYFILLQNITEREGNELAVLAKHSPHAFLLASEHI